MAAPALLHATPGARAVAAAGLGGGAPPSPWGHGLRLGGWTDPPPHTHPLCCCSGSRPAGGAGRFPPLSAPSSGHRGLARLPPWHAGWSQGLGDGAAPRASAQPLGSGGLVQHPQDPKPNSAQLGSSWPGTWPARPQARGPPESQGLAGLSQHLHPPTPPVLAPVTCARASGSRGPPAPLAVSPGSCSLGQARPTWHGGQLVSSFPCTRGLI